MFDSLSNKLESIFSRLTGRGILSEEDIDTALGEIRVALLDADVNLAVVKDICARVREKSIGTKVLKSLNPGQMVIKAVHDELITTMGTHEPLNLRHAPPVIIMVVGLQGSGKTTTIGKLARHLKKDLKRNPLIVSADVYRPAAILQLKTLGDQVGVSVFPSDAEQKPLDIAKRALAHAISASYDTLIIDTAGRLQINEALMNELVEMVEAVEPHEILLVVDAMTGQEAVNVARGFDERLDIDGVVLTKLDGDARGGAALSMRAVLKKPIKFVGIGEKSDAIEVFHPDRLISRVMGMGDMLTLIEKASKEVDLEDAMKIQKKLKKDQFTLEDFYSQLQSVKKMGSMGSLLKMMPGAGKLTKDFDEEKADKELHRVEAMILSMTPAERRDHTIIDGSRRRRISAGSGTTVEDLNRLLEQFGMMRKMMKQVSKLGPNAMRGLSGLMGKGMGGGMPFSGMRPPR